MSASRHSLDIRCNPTNPVLYLACCGLFDLLSRIDPEARGHWHASAQTAFRMESALGEEEFLAVLLGTFCAPSRWEFLPEAAAEPTRVTAGFQSPGEQNKFTVELDWWFETAELTGAIAEKSAWKMFAGQQTVSKITGDMVDAIADLRRKDALPTTLTALLACEVAMSGRFGLDPRSSRSALDVGYSPNDLGLAVNTAPFTELLAIFGLASFFPGRTGRPLKLSSARGWRDRIREKEKPGGGRVEGRDPGFLYRLWRRPLPIALARVHACRANAADLTLFSVRATRKNYSNLTMSQTPPPSTK